MSKLSIMNTGVTILFELQELLKEEKIEKDRIIHLLEELNNINFLNSIVGEHAIQGWYQKLLNEIALKGMDD